MAYPETVKTYTLHCVMCGIKISPTRRHATTCCEEHRVAYSFLRRKFPNIPDEFDVRPIDKAETSEAYKEATGKEAPGAFLKQYPDKGKENGSVAESIPEKSGDSAQGEAPTAVVADTKKSGNSAGKKKDKNDKKGKK